MDMRTPGLVEAPPGLEGTEAEAWRQGWLAGYLHASHTSSNSDTSFKFEWVMNNCHVTYWPEVMDGVPPHPIEHDLHVRKDSRVLLESYMSRRHWVQHGTA